MRVEEHSRVVSQTRHVEEPGSATGSGFTSPYRNISRSWAVLGASPWVSHPPLLLHCKAAGRPLWCPDKQSH